MEQATQEDGTFTADQFIEKLKKALARDGDFPASARIVNELKALTSNPKTTSNQITEAILKEPSLGIRVLHLVNSTFYRRAQPIMTVSQAVMQIGMRPLADLCAGLVLLQKFVPAARSGGPFANCLQKTLLSSLLASSISAESTKNDPNSKNSESGYLAGTFAEIGTLLLAYYFPQVYENAIKRSETKKQDVEKSIYEIVGLSPTDLSREIIKSLDLPDFYNQILTASDSYQTPGGNKNAASQKTEVINLSKGVNAAQNISKILVFSKDKSELDKVLSSLHTRLQLDAQVINKVLGDLPKLFQSHCEQIDLHLPPLPEFVATYSQPDSAAGDGKDESEEKDDFSRYVDEIRQAVESGEPTASVITTVMETLAWGLKFDRVLLLLVGSGRKKLVGRMMLGNPGNVDPTKVERPIGAEADSHAPDARCYKEGLPVFNGDPLLDDGWPLMACPIGFGPRAIGVIYADRTGSSAPEITAREQAAIGVLAELLDRSVSMSA